MPLSSRTSDRTRSRSLAGIAVAAAFTVALPAGACAQSSLPGGGSSGSNDISIIPPNILHPPVRGVGAGKGVPIAISPAVTTTTVMDGLNIPWDVVRTPDGTILTGERGGRMMVKPVNGAAREVAI